jgi:hypothetical protein
MIIIAITITITIFISIIIITITITIIIIIIHALFNSSSQTADGCEILQAPDLEELRCMPRSGTWRHHGESLSLWGVG